MGSEDEIDETEPMIQRIDGSNVSSNESCGSFICNPRKFFFRYFALIFMCMLGFGSYFW
jgi:hypothetical protein